ncbi:MAG: chemotaxis protein CheW [Peptococcaceae bacterium]|jgi:purine-binding chemotaxis protein CheW|nr:chemotaxis protein CheW [Peptococcaceae bacterium]
MNRQIVVFLLADQEYGVDIGRVYEIIRYDKPVRLPRMQASVEGVIHLREHIIPVVDLGARLDLAPSAADPGADAGRIVIVDAQGLMVGLKVEAVREVRNLAGDSVKPPPAGTGYPPGGGEGYVEGIALADGRLIIMLDVGKLFSRGEAAALALNTGGEVAAVV